MEYSLWTWRWTKESLMTGSSLRRTADVGGPTLGVASRWEEARGDTPAGGGGGRRMRPESGGTPPASTAVDGRRRPERTE
jgi:hypothetical protein